MSSSNNKMTSIITPNLSLSSTETTPPFTTANLAAHQRTTMAAGSSTTSSRGGWVCGGEMYHRPATPNPEQWNALMKHDQLAADIDGILRAAVNAKKGQGN
jgi:hypothetical protein